MVVGCRRAFDLFWFRDKDGYRDDVGFQRDLQFRG